MLGASFNTHNFDFQKHVITIDSCSTDNECTGSMTPTTPKSAVTSDISIGSNEDIDPVSILLKPPTCIQARVNSKEGKQSHSRKNSTLSSTIVDIEKLRDTDLEKQLDEHHLKSILSRFTLQRASNADVEKEDIEIYMDSISFCDTIVELFMESQSLEYTDLKQLSNNAVFLFKKIDWQRNGRITWDDICSYLLMDITEDSVASKRKLLSRPRIINFRGVKDTIVKFMRDCNSSRYVQVTRNGLINILSSNLSIKRSHMMDGCTHASSNPRSRKLKVWVTDSVCVSDINKLFITTANRDVQVYDLASPHFSQIYNLYDMPNAAMCMYHHYVKVHPYGKCYLFLGTDSGDIHFFTFLQPSKGLFEIPFTKRRGSKSSCEVLFANVPNHSKYVTHRVISQVHSDWVRNINYVPEDDLLFSCSPNTQDALVYQSLHKVGRKVYKFQVTKGIECFDYSKKLNLIVTGSVDHIVRLWDPYVTTKAIAILKFHESAIIDCIIYEPACQVFSYSKDGLLCCSDTKEYTCLQEIHLKFPLIGRSGMDHGLHSIYIYPTLMKLMITGENCVAEIKISTGSVQSELSDVAHNSPVVGAVCNSLKEQVVSVSESGEIILWSISTGKKIFTINEEKITGEVSAMALDISGEKLVTGSRNGTGAIWNLSTATCERQLEAFSDEEITCILILPGNKKVFMFGWSKKILAYQHSPVTTVLTPDRGWLDVNAHQDDILSAVYWAPHFIATSCFDGSIHIWQIESKRLWKVIQGRNTSQFNMISNRSLLLNSRRSSRRSSRKSMSAIMKMGDMSGVDVLLYLEKRNAEVEAPLVAVEGNAINFWCSLSSEKPVASFLISDVICQEYDLFITAVATDLENKYLFTADNNGSVAVWDIEGYASYNKFSSLVSKLTEMRKESESTPIVSTRTTAPRLVTSWQSHDGEITSLSCLTRKNNIYIVSASADCQVKLWTMSGSFVGKFSQMSLWTLRRKSLGKQQEVQPLTNTAPGLPTITTIAETREHSNTSSITADVEKIDSLESYKIRSEIMSYAKDQNDSCVSLGQLYKDRFNQRMEGRRHRRSLLSEMDERLLGEKNIGVSCLCLPFKALMTAETKDYIMPHNLPFTSHLPHNLMLTSHIPSVNAPSPASNIISDL